MVLVALVCMLAVFCLPVMATSYTVSGTDMTIELDNSAWYVFTRDNLEDNPEVAEIGADAEAMSALLQSQNIYLDAISKTNYMSVELTVFKNRNEFSKEAGNLSERPRSEVDKLVQNSQNGSAERSFSVYENTYTFVEETGIDKGFYYCKFLTVVNQEEYILQFISGQPIDQTYARQIVDTVRFDVDTSLNPQRASFFDSVAGRTVIGGVIGACAVGVTALIAKKNKKKKAAEPAQPGE